MKKIYIVFLGLVFMALQGFSQQGALLYNMEKIPQVNSVNPSFFPENKWWLQIFSITPTIYSPVSFSDIFRKGPNGSKYFDEDYFMSKLGNTNRLLVSTDFNFLSFGIRASNWMFTFSNTIHFYGNIESEKDFFGTLFYGNMAYLGNETSLLGQNFGDMMGYYEMAFGAGYKINNQWTVGAKIKPLLGLAHVTTGDSDLQLYTANDLSQVKIKANIDGRMSSFLQFDSTDIDQSTVQIPSNFGLGFDLGATFKLNDKFEFSASLLDIGFINWTQNLKRIVNSEISEFGINGFDVYDDMIGPGELDVQKITDSLEKLFDYDLQDGGPSYSTSLPFKYYLSGSYRIFPTLKASVLYRGEILRKHYYSSATINLDYTLGNWFEVSVGNSFVGSSWFNPGLGLNFTIANTFQLFFATNYISSFYLADTRTFSAQFGMNLTFGKSGNTKKNFQNNEGISLKK